MRALALIIRLYCLIILLIDLSDGDTEQPCLWTKYENAPEVYYINLERSKERRKNLEKHLDEVGLKYNRVVGLLPQEIYIPHDIETTWRTAWCKLKSSEILPSRQEINLAINSPFKNYTSVMVGLCGRGKGKNTPKELGCTTSHLLAMRRAIYSDHKSRYALIIEDDVTFPFTIDFEALVRSAPSDFGILQLFNSNKVTMVDSWQKYLNNPESLWSESKNLKYWSTCGYLIDKIVMKPVIDSIVKYRNGWQEFAVIAGIQGPCSPPECCQDGNFIQKPPCVWASWGYQADSYLYAMTKTYMIHVPLITNGKGVGSSTFHQEHVEMFHKSAFRKQRQIINDMLSGLVKPPPFAVPACKSLNISLN